MSKKETQLQFNNLHTPNAPTTVPLPAPFETKVAPGGGLYHERCEHQPLLPDQVPLRHSPNWFRKNRPQGSFLPSPVNPVGGSGHCNCGQPNVMSPSKDFNGSENVHPSPSPHLYSLYSQNFDNPQGASMCDIELSMNDDEGQNNGSMGLLSAPSSRLSTQSNAKGLLTTMNSPINNNQSSNFLHIERCSDDCCHNCIWHRFVLNNPHYILWEDKVRTVVLKRPPNKSTGFSNKFKTLVNTEEAYVLVSEVRRNSEAARCKLAVGDMILSVNNVPLQTLKKYKETDFKATELKMLIQRPQQILDKGLPALNNLMKKSDILKTPKTVEPVSPSTSPDQAPVMERQPFEAIQLHSLKRSESSTHCLPQARVFLCGNCTLDFIQRMFGYLITVSSNTQAFIFQVSMEKLPDGTVRIDNSQAYIYISEDSSKESINVEFVAVFSDSFFYNCCSWMFTPDSIFIMTFDPRKLSLSTNAEMAKLSNLAKTILNHPTQIPFDNLKLFGVKPPGDDTTIDLEVQTLFLTSLAATLPQPKIISLSEPVALQSVKEEIFNLAMCRRQLVLPVTTSVMDKLIVYPNFIVTKQELFDALPETLTKPRVILNDVIRDLKTTGNLVEVGEEREEFLIPCKFLDCVAKLIQYFERGPNISGLSSDFPGLFTGTDLLESLDQIVPNAQRLLSFMTEENIVYPARRVSRDSGFSEGSTFIIPYFIEDSPFHIQAEKYYELFSFECTHMIPLAAFLHLLSDLTFHDRIALVRVESQTVFHILWDKQELMIHLDKGSNRILVFSCSTNRKFSGKPLIREIMQTSICQHTGGDVVCKDSCEANAPNETNPENLKDDAVNQPLLNVLPAEEPLPVPIIENARNENCTHRKARLLETPMIDLIRVHEPMQKIFEFLSIRDKWKDFGGYLGLSFKDIQLYESKQKESSKLPGYLFLSSYMTDSHCTLESILKSLQEMGNKELICLDLASELWTHAWMNNAHRYFTD